MYVHVCAFMCVGARVRVSVRVYVHVCGGVRVSVCMCMYVGVCACARVRVSVHVSRRFHFTVDTPGQFECEMIVEGIRTPPRSIRCWQSLIFH